jgi:hypothetical protein
MYHCCHRLLDLGVNNTKRLRKTKHADFILILPLLKYSGLYLFKNTLLFLPSWDMTKVITCYHGKGRYIQSLH